MAAALRKTPGVDVELVDGHYGEFTVLLDGELLLSGGALAFLGVLPTVRRVREAVARKAKPAGA